jgi:hypothetical protein
MTDYRDDIDKIIDWFDFERVHRVMAHLDWKWGSPGEFPQLPELRQKARQLMNEAVQGLERGDTDEFNLETGGFVVRVNRSKEEDDKIWIKLAFQLTSWDNYE